jgi:hypothetical protein
MLEVARGKAQLSLEGNGSRSAHDETKDDQQQVKSNPRQSLIGRLDHAPKLSRKGESQKPGVSNRHRGLAEATLLPHVSFIPLAFARVTVERLFVTARSLTQRIRFRVDW